MGALTFGAYIDAGGGGEAGGTGRVEPGTWGCLSPGGTLPPPPPPLSPPPGMVGGGMRATGGVMETTGGTLGTEIGGSWVRGGVCGCIPGESIR